MNASRVAKALRELADALEANDVTEAPARESETRQVARKAPASCRPPVEINEVDMARARKSLRRLGVPV